MDVHSGYMDTGLNAIRTPTRTELLYLKINLTKRNIIAQMESLRMGKEHYHLNLRFECSRLDLPGSSPPRWVSNPVEPGFFHIVSLLHRTERKELSSNDGTGYQAHYV